MIQRLAKWFKGGAEGGASSAPELRVLMVCMGNICRSPTAEGVLRVRLHHAGLQHRVLVDSAGTHGYHTGEPPDPRAIRHAARRGYDLSGLRARPVVPEDFDRFDWMLVMDENNLAWLRDKAPAGHAVRLELLMRHARRHGQLQAVPDPYYGAADGFEHVLDLVEDACDGVVAELHSLLAGRAPA